MFIVTITFNRYKRVCMYIFSEITVTRREPTQRRTEYPLSTWDTSQTTLRYFFWTLSSWTFGALPESWWPQESRVTLGVRVSDHEGGL